MVAKKKRAPARPDSNSESNRDLALQRIEMLQIAAENVAGSFTAWSSLLKNGPEGAQIELLRVAGDIIFEANRVLHGVKDGREIARNFFVSVVEDVARVQRGEMPRDLERWKGRDAMLKIRRDAIARGGAARYARLRFGSLFPDLAARISDEKLADAINACLIATRGAPTAGKRGRPSKWTVLAQVWKLISGASVAPRTLKVAAGRPRDSQGKRET